jgi:hypothetical protein
MKLFMSRKGGSAKENLDQVASIGSHVKICLLLDSMDSGTILTIVEPIPRANQLGRS